MQVFWGPDEFGAREEIGRLAEEFTADVQWVDKQAVAEKPIAQWIDEGAGGLFGRSLTVALDPASWLKADQELLGMALDRDPKLLIVWQRGEFDKRAGWYAKAKRSKKAREWVELTSGQLAAWVDAYVQEQQGQIAREATMELVARVGSDRWRLRSELDKLLVLEGAIDVATVRRHVPEGEVAGEVFAMLDAMATGNRVGATRRLSALLESGESEFYILSMVAYQLRTLLVVRQGQEAGQSESMVAKIAGLHPYVVQKNWRAAERWSRSQLVGLMTRLLATDMAIKRGVVEPRTGVTMMLVGMTS